MLNYKYLNLFNKINELHFWLIGYLCDNDQKDEVILLEKLERNIKSMKAIIEKSQKIA